MKKRINLYTILGFSFLALFLILFALLFVDRGNVTNTGEVGLKTINGLVKYEYVKAWDVLSDIFLYLGIAAVLGLVCVGAYQLIKRKSLFKVDRYIVIFGVFLIIGAFLWIMFDKIIVVNYRPIYHYDIEPSFPSTHTFLTIFIYLSAHGIACILSNDKRIKYGSLALAILISLIVSCARVLSGMHYITDVLAGILLGLSLYFTCFGIIKSANPIEEEENE